MFKGSYNRAYDDYVCTDKPGNLLTPRYVTLRFSQVLEKNGMRHIRFHDLRHTFASILINKDIPIFNVLGFPAAKTNGSLSMYFYLITSFVLPESTHAL